MIVVPFFSTWHAPFVEAALSASGEACRVLAAGSEEAVRAGLEAVNNDACYTALLAAGRTVELLRADGGASDAMRARAAAAARRRLDVPRATDEPFRVAVPSPCVRCRGDDAPYLVRQALVASELGGGVPVIDGIEALESAAADARAVARLADALAFGDALLQARLRIRPYTGPADALAFDALLAACADRARGALVADAFALEEGLHVLDEELSDFGAPARDGRPIVGVVGALPAVFDEHMNAGLVASIEREGCEVALPYLLPLAAAALRGKGVAVPLGAALDERCLVLQRSAGAGFRCPTARDLERAGTEIVPRFLVQGAGWAIAGAALLFARAGVRDLVYARTFGCLAGQVTGQGAVKPLRVRCAAEGMDANIATIEFDPGTSEVNQLNRIKLLTAVAKRAAKRRRNNP